MLQTGQRFSVPRGKQSGVRLGRLPERLLAFSTADIVAYTSKDVMFAEIWHKLPLPDRKTVTPPLFLFFTAEDIPVAARGLDDTRFATRRPLQELAPGGEEERKAPEGGWSVCYSNQFLVEIDKLKPFAPNPPY